MFIRGNGIHAGIRIIVLRIDIKIFRNDRLHAGNFFFCHIVLQFIRVYRAVGMMIGDLDAGSQVKLLRVLQDRTYEVLGSSRAKTVDVRVICATNKNLGEMAAKNTFREDLLYRINLVTIHLPPLRERPRDIPLLVNFFLHNLKEIYGRPALTVTKDALKWLQQLPLP